MSEKGKMKSPFRLECFLWSLFYFIKLTIFVCHHGRHEEIKAQKIDGEDVSDDNNDGDDYHDIYGQQHNGAELHYGECNRTLRC